MPYTGIVDKGQSFDMYAKPGSPLLRDTVCAAVKWSGDGRIVQRGQLYWAGDAPSQKELKRRADAMAVKWQSYLKRTGKRFELEQDAKRKAKEAKRKAERDKRRAVAEAGPRLLAMLERMVKAARFNEELPLIEADAMIAELK